MHDSTRTQDEMAMTEKRVKAWAVVDSAGSLVSYDNKQYLVFGNKPRPEHFADDERVIPVEIVWKEGK